MLLAIKYTLTYVPNASRLQLWIMIGLQGCNSSSYISRKMIVLWLLSENHVTRFPMTRIRSAPPSYITRAIATIKNIFFVWRWPDSDAGVWVVSSLHIGFNFQFKSPNRIEGNTCTGGWWLYMISFAHQIQKFGVVRIYIQLLKL